MRVIPLGTSSGVPTRARNVSAVAVALESRWVLLDCGEGTQHRIMRAPLKPRQLEAIFITHLHGDHVYGLPGLLSTMSMQGRAEPLAVHGPPGLRELLECVRRATGLQLAYELSVIETDAARPGRPGPIHRAPGYQVIAGPLDHRGPAQGYAVLEDARPGSLDIERIRALGLFGALSGPDFGKLKGGQDLALPGGQVLRSRDVLRDPRPGRRVAYCTDTRPCAGAIELASRADLLVHEATYLEELAEQADERGHSTARGAARVAREAGAKRLLLTHFSPRYPDPSPLVAEARSVFAASDAARDLEEIAVS